MFKIVKSGTDRKELGFKEFVFPAGEVSVKLNCDYNYQLYKVPSQTLIARIQSSDDLMKLAMLKDALDRFDDNTTTNLFMPYVPYGRQDRVCDKGESFSLKVLGNFINNLHFKSVTIVDPHSHVTEGVFDRLEVISQLKVINLYREFQLAASNKILVSPDAGSNKKVSELAFFFGHTSFIRADKLRDLSNGKIKETIVYCDDLKGQDVTIIDDLIERGNTFLALSKALRNKNCGKIILYVTHGIFGGIEKDKTIANLFAGGIDEIYTTNSYRTDLLQTDTFHVHDFDAI